MDKTLKSIFDYTDYRKYLLDYYAWAKANKRGFSHRAFMAKTGMSGPNYFKRVMEGVHDLTEHSIPKFSQALELSGAEADCDWFRAVRQVLQILALQGGRFRLALDRVRVESARGRPVPSVVVHNLLRSVSDGTGGSSEPSCDSRSGP